MLDFNYARAHTRAMETVSSWNRKEQDEKERKAFLDSCSVSELSPEEAEIFLMQMFPKKVPLDINLDEL